MCRRICAPPESNIRIYSIRLNTAVRQLQTYSPKGYTSVTVGVSPTASNKSTRHLDSSLFVLHLNMLLANLLVITPLTTLTPNDNTQQDIWILHSSFFTLHLNTILSSRCSTRTACCL